MGREKSQAVRPRYPEAFVFGKFPKYCGLRSMAKNDERKQMITWLIKNRTTVRDEWICKRMRMGRRSNVSRFMSRITESKVKDAKWNRLLHICSD